MRASITLLAEISSIVGAIIAFVVAFVGARTLQDAKTSIRMVLSAHLSLVGAWANGGSGWGPTQISNTARLSWLKPSTTIFRLDSGLALVQMTLLEKFALGPRLSAAVVHLNQAIASFNAVLEKVERIRANEARLLHHAHERISKNWSNHHEGKQLNELTRKELLDPLDVEQKSIAEPLLELIEMLHTGLIGQPDSRALCHWYLAVREEFAREFGQLAASEV